MYEPRQLQLAWDRLDLRTTGERRRRGAGVDGVTVEQFAERAGEEMARLGEELRTGTYRPRAVRRHWIPKPGTNKKRPLGLPCVRDKVVQEALRSLIEPIFECEFLDGSHGFRPNRSTDTACQQLEAWLRKGKGWVVDADITGCYDNIDQERLLDEVNRRIADGKVLNLIRAFLKAGVMEDMKVRDSEKGTPQGGIISPLLANIYLHAMDEELESRGIAWVRYADDFLLLCSSREEAEAALEAVQVILAGMGLSLSPEKTRIVHLDEGFDFLGWHYQGHKRWPRRKSVEALKLKVREKTRRLRPGSMEEICGELRPILQGWYNYFREGNSSQVFGKVSGWVRRRLRSILHRRHKGHGMGSGALNRRWPNSRFAGWGLFQLDAALATYRSANHAQWP
jgi:RNA-directed DNA polymerase